MKRKEIDVCLAIVLLFTGIGLIIYLIYYFSQKEVRCVHCNSICEPLGYQASTRQLEYQEQTQAQYPSSSPQPSYNENYNNPESEIMGSAPKYCPFCGSQLDNREQKFCANCGNTLQ
jgi:ribosomal protein S27E